MGVKVWGANHETETSATKNNDLVITDSGAARSDVVAAKYAGATGAAVPTDAVQIAAWKSGGNLTAVEVDARNSVKVGERPSDTLYAGSNASVTTTGAALSTTQACHEVVVQADPDNTDSIFVGNSTTQPIQLKANTSITIPVNDVATIYVKSLSGTQTANWLARN